MSYSISNYAHETLISYPTATASYGITTTSHPLLSARAEDDATTTSKSRSRTVSHTSSATSSAPCTDKQKCQTSANSTPLTIGLSVGIPIFVFALIIGVFAIRNYRKGKKEAENDDDPDFYGETTILPDYPTHPDPNNSHYDMSFPPNANMQHDNGSYYSNPFQGETSRYPANVISPRFPNAANNQYDNVSINQSLNQSETKYGSFTLPYQHNMGSKQSLDALAKEIGSEYTAYQLGAPNTRPSSREISRNTSRQNSPHRGSNGFENQSSNDSSSFKKSVEGGTTLKNVSTEEEHEFHPAVATTNSNVTAPTSSSSFPDTNTDSKIEEVDSFTVESDDGEDVFKDSYAQPQHSPIDFLQDENLNSHRRNISEFSYIANDPEILNQDVDQWVASNNSLNKKSQPAAATEVNKVELEESPLKNARFETLNDGEPKIVGDEDDENVQRMKSVYRIYFDRENSVRSKRATMPPLENGEGAPPLPQIDTSFVEVGDHTEETGDELPIAESSHLIVDLPGSKGRGHRFVSSIYSTIPMAKFGNNGEILHSQEEHENGEQQSDQGHFNQQQYYQNQIDQGHFNQQNQYHQQQYYDPQYAAAQNQQSYQSQSPQMNQQPYFVPQPVQPLAPAQSIPNPTKIGYDSVISNPVYAPKKSLTSSTRPQIEIKPFNPLHYSDKIFSPTSPVISSSPSFSNSGSQFDLPSTSSVPSPHHIRQSIVMIDPVEIGAAKLYRPAGSFTRELHSTNSSRSGSISSQSGTRGAFYNPDGSRNEVLPRAGSQMDLRKQLGASDNYQF